MDALADLSPVRLVWFMLVLLLGINLGVWAALLYRSPSRPSRQRSNLYVLAGVALTLMLAFAIGKLRPAGPERGNDSYPAALVTGVAWIAAYWGVGAILRRHGRKIDTSSKKSAGR